MIKSAQNVIGSVMCCPGCFSLYRASAIRQVMDKYATPTRTPFTVYVKDTGRPRGCDHHKVSPRNHRCSMSVRTTFIVFVNDTDRPCDCDKRHMIGYLPIWRYLGHGYQDNLCPPV